MTTLPWNRCFLVVRSPCLGQPDPLKTIEADSEIGTTFGTIDLDHIPKFFWFLTEANAPLVLVKRSISDLSLMLLVLLMANCMGEIKLESDDMDQTKMVISCLFKI